MDIIKKSIKSIILNSNLNSKEKKLIMHYYKYLTKTEQNELIKTLE